MRFDEVLAELEGGLLQKIHGFCRLKLGADLEAEDLAQIAPTSDCKSARPTPTLFQKNTSEKPAPTPSRRGFPPPPTDWNVRHG